MYNLFVAGHADAWNGESWKADLNRCVREFTSDTVQEAYGALGRVEIDQLKSLPCIFAYEAIHRLDPHFGLIRDITLRPSQDKVRVKYELHPVDPFLSADQLKEMTFELDIGELELHRNHWAVKNVNLPAELKTRRGLHSCTGQHKQDQVSIWKTTSLTLPCHSLVKIETMSGR